MFRSFIYANTEKIYEYFSVIDEAIKEKIITKEISITDTAALKANSMGIERSTTEKRHSEISQYFLSDYNKFEKELEKLDGQSYFDIYEHYETYDIDTMPKTSIGKIHTSFYIPDEFDYVELLNAFKPYIKESLNVKESEEGLYEAFLGNSKADIPIIIEFDGKKVYGKIDARYLNEDYNQLEEYESDEVTILFKKISNKQGKITVFDPLKDFIKLNRAMRRSPDFKNDYPDEILPIVIDGPAISIEILAIYK